jgi:hypothetical protein
MLIHAAITADRRPRAMLLINYVAPEPHPPPTIHDVDAVTVLLQTVLSSFSAGDGVVVSAMPTLRVEDASAVEVTAPGLGRQLRRRTRGRRLWNGQRRRRLHGERSRRRRHGG